MKQVALVMSVVALLLVGGCFDYTENMVLNADGSGEVSVRYAMDKEYAEKIAEMQAEMARLFSGEEAETESLFDMWAEEQLRETLAAEGQGIELLSYNEAEEDGMLVWEMAFAFDDVNKLYVLYDILGEGEDEVMQGEMYGEEEEAETEEDMPPIFTQQEDGTWLFYRPMDEDMGDEPFGGEAEYGDVMPEDEPAEGSEATEVETESEETEQSLEDVSEEFRAAFEGRKIKMVVTFPGEIIESNATSVEGNTATWEYPLTEIEKAGDIRAVIKK